MHLKSRLELTHFRNVADENNPKYVCGRPLGLAFDTISDKMIVMDSSNGVFELNLKNGEKTRLVSDTDVIGSSVRQKLSNRIP